jgi:hypothetical protein
MIVDYVYLIISTLKLYRVRAKFVRKARQEQAERRAEADARRNLYAAWRCPDCRRPLGPKVCYVNYAADNIIVTHRGPFTRHVLITCDHCLLLNVFDPTGTPLFEPGELVEDRVATWRTSHGKSLVLEAPGRLSHSRQAD